MSSLLDDPLRTFFLVCLVFAGVLVILVLRALRSSLSPLAHKRATDDAGRLAQNVAMYARAVAGDLGALDWLQVRAGDCEPRDVDGFGFVPAWATARARNDALMRYRQALRTLGPRATEQKPA